MLQTYHLLIEFAANNALVYKNIGILLEKRGESGRAIIQRKFQWYSRTSTSDTL